MNCTPATPILSEAVAVMEVVLNTVAPFDGDVIETVGAIVSVAAVTVTVVDCVVVPPGPVHVSVYVEVAAGLTD